MIQLWKRTRKKKGQRQGSLAIPIHDVLTPAASATDGSPERGLSPQERGRPTDLRLVLRRKYSYLGGSFSSEGNFQVNKRSWVAPQEGGQGTWGQQRHMGSPIQRPVLLPPLPSHWRTCPWRGKEISQAKEVRERVRGRKGPLSHGGLPLGL